MEPRESNRSGNRSAACVACRLRLLVRDSFAASRAQTAGSSARSGRRHRNRMPPPSRAGVVPEIECHSHLGRALHGGALMGYAGRGGHRGLACESPLTKAGLCRCSRGRISQVDLAELQVGLRPLAS